MPVHEVGLLSTLVISLVAAFCGGLLARSLRLPPLLGYILAGFAIGPFSPGFVANQSLANELAEVGVALLLFNIGLHFSFKDLLAVQKIVVPGALGQIVVTTSLGSVLAFFVLHTPWATSLVIGMSMAIASTAVVTRILAERRQLTSLAGRLALGWLVVQDLVVIIALVLLPVLGKASDVSVPMVLSMLGQTLLQVAGFVAVMVLGGRRGIPSLLGYVARSGSRELFTLSVIVIALGIAYGSAMIFGVSLALGAFFAGVVIGESDLNHHAASEALSMQQVFTILFFVSVGMLFDPHNVPAMAPQIITFLLVIILGMGGVSFLALLALHVPLRSAALVGATFAQIGEFSFILAELGFQSGFYGSDERDLIIAVALLSILINPLVLGAATRLARWVEGTAFFTRLRSHDIEMLPPESGGLQDHTILIGHGRVGAIVASALREHGLRHISIEANRRLTEKLRRDGELVIFGDASREAVMSAASPERAKLIIISVPDPFLTKQIVRLVRKNYPSVGIVVRTHSDEESRALIKLGVGLAVMGEREIAFGMTYYALQTLGFDTDQTRSIIGQIRQEIYRLDRDGQVS